MMSEPSEPTIQPPAADSAPPPAEEEELVPSIKQPEQSAASEEGTSLKKEAEEEDPSKRAREEPEAADAADGAQLEAKKSKTEPGAEGVDGDGEEPPLVPPATEGTSIFHDADVLSGRGGGTNVHPGNREFRDLINLHRRSYLKARKNDKPAISRSIVRSIRDAGGRFLKKDEKTGLWLEIGDDAAREKTSQALRQRAPEMRKLLFDTEREEARAAAEEHVRQQRLMMGLPPDAPLQGMPGMQQPMPFANPAFFQAMAANNAAAAAAANANNNDNNGNKQQQQQAGNPTMGGANPAAYQQMFALMGNNAAAAAAVAMNMNAVAQFAAPQQQQQQQQQQNAAMNNSNGVAAAMNPSHQETPKEEASV